MANERQFTLIGKFDDQITKKLRELNETVNKLNKPLSKDNFPKSIVDGFTASNKELKELQKQLDQIGKFKMNFDRSGIKAAQEDANVLMKQLEEIEKKGANFDRSGLKAAQGDALTLGKILEANALIKVGEGFANSLAAGTQSAVGALKRGMQFVGGQFGKGVQDQLGDIQARGSLFGSLQKQGMFQQAMEGKEGQALSDATNEMYLQTKNISRSMEGAINEVIRTSTVSSETIQILSRQLSDNLLPSMLKEKEITDLSTISREKLNEVMGGKDGIATRLATFYSQVASVIPSPQYAAQAAMGITQFLGSGTINRQLAIFEQNPVLTDALREGLTKFGDDIEGRIKAASYGFSIAMPEAALEEAKNTIAGGLQSVQDTLLGPSGILAMTADVPNQGEKTLQIMKDSGARAMEIERFDKRNAENLAKFKADKSNSDQEVAEFEKKLAEGRIRFIKGLDDFYKSADSPIEVLATQFGPLLQSFANMINNAGNLFIGPINSLVETIAPGVSKLKENFDNLGSNLAAYMSGGKGIKMSLGEVLGRAFAEILKTLALYFNPEKAGEEIGGGINKFFEDFMKGFKGGEVDGEFYLRMVLDTIQLIIMKLIFKDGKVLEGFTPLGDALAKVFLLLAAPAFIMSLISGLTPLAISGFGSLITGVFKGLVAPVALGTKVTTSGGAALGALGAGGVLATTLTVVALIALVTAAFVIFEGPLRALAKSLSEWGDMLMNSQNWASQAFGLVVLGLSKVLSGLTDFFTGLWDVISGMFTGDSEKIIGGIKKMFKGVVDVFEGVILQIAGLGAVIVIALGNFFKAIADWVTGAETDAEERHRRQTMPEFTPPPGLPSQRPAGQRPPGRPAAAPAPSDIRSRMPTFGNAFGSANPFYGTLTEAINFEMANKPPGSHLVIANSSETIIPAAGGLAGDGIEGLIAAIWGAAQMSTGNITKAVERGAGITTSYLSRGFSATQSTLGQGFSRTQQMTARSMELSSRENTQILQAIRAAAAAGGFGGGAGGLGKIPGSLSSAAALARSFGLQLTSFRRNGPASESYHNVGRAMDFSNGVGPTPEMMAYAQQMVQRHGSRLTELIYTPLGFSIKHGQRVSPIAAETHYNHVHVAYALGPGQPAFFQSQLAAEAWERKMIPASLRVRSITTNSGESLGGATVNAPITIYQQPNQDAEQLAAMVAIRIGMAVDELRNRM